MSASAEHSEIVRRLQVELEQLRKLTDDLTEFRGLRFSVETARGSCYDVSVSGALAFMTELTAKCLHEAAAGATSPGMVYHVPLHFVVVIAKRVS